MSAISRLNSAFLRTDLDKLHTQSRWKVTMVMATFLRPRTRPKGTEQLIIEALEYTDSRVRTLSQCEEDSLTVTQRSGV